jgi:NitT/TauT family transport system substrate-binding protein
MHSRRERAGIGYALIVFGALVLCACGVTSPSVAQPTQAPLATSTPEPVLKLRIADGVNPPAALPQSVTILAAHHGYFQREGLDAEIEVVNGTPAIITAMRSGNVDVGIINSADVIKLQAQKTLEMKVIGSPNGRNFWMIVSRDSVGTLSELRGKSYAISRVGSEDHALALTVLKAKGIETSDIDFIALGIPTVRVQALVANQLAATTTTIGTWVTIQRQPGVKILVPPDDFWATAPLMSNTSAATIGVVREKPEALQRYSRAMLQTARYYAQHKDEWVRDMGALRQDIQPGDLADLWDQFKTAWAVNGQLNLTTFQKTSDYLYATEDFKDVPRIEVRDWVDTQFVDAALAQLGVYPGIDDPGRSVR